MHKHKLVLLMLCLALAVSAAPLAFAGEDIGNYDAVYDTANDAGKLTARFLSLTPTSDEKPGDCTILTSPEGLVMVIDAGEPSSGGQVVDALNAMGVTRIDFLVASHPHIDHVGGLPDVMRNFEIGTVYTSAVEYPTNTYKAYMDEIDAQGLEHVILAQGDVLNFGENVKVEVFHPGREITYYDNYPDSSTQFINDLSLVLKFSYGDSTMLFAGDLYSHGEKEVIGKAGDALNVDVIKINHHGAKTSSSKSWREAVSAEIGVAMHDAIADLRVAQKYAGEGMDVYLTFLDGCVRISTTGDATYEVLTQYNQPHDFLYP